MQVSECFFNGYYVKFLEWFPNFSEEKIECKMPSWFILRSLPPELCQEDIITSIGSVVGEVEDIDASFYCCNSIKILINVKFDHPSKFRKEFLTSKAKYEILFKTYKGKIIDILKFDKSHKIMPRILPLTSDVRSKFPWLRIMKNRRLQEIEEHKSQSKQ